MLSLPHGLAFEDLYSAAGLARLDGHFLDALAHAAPALHERFGLARAAPAALTRKQESELLLELASHVEQFVAQLFGIEAQLAASRAEHERLESLYTCKRQFVQRKAATRVKPQEVAGLDGGALEAERIAHRRKPPVNGRRPKPN